MQTIASIADQLLTAVKGAEDVILLCVGIFGIHGGMFWFLSFFCTRTFKPAENMHKYAVCIPARNEEQVIGNLLESIALQDYPKELITVFVVADNCTDNTASIAREKGAICYERFDDRHKTKGYAVSYLFECIRADYGIEAFEGYFIFDADNLLKRDFVSRMNDSFDSGCPIITSYRNSKNFDENWIASTYAIHWLRSIRKNHRARSVLHLATNLQGTGYLFSNVFVKDGWNYTSLTEDRAFTVDAVIRGYEITYNDAAMFYDEQPTSLSIALRQRLRWSKGFLQAFASKGLKLFAALILGTLLAERSRRPATLWGRIVEDLRYRAACFDTMGQLIPSGLLHLIFWLITVLLLPSIVCLGQGFEGVLFNSSSNLIKAMLYALFGPVPVACAPGVWAFVCCFIFTLVTRLMARAWRWIESSFTAAYLLFMESERIVKLPVAKQLLFCLAWPVFDLIHAYTSFAALFVRVGWKPIPHNSKIRIENLSDQIHV